MNEVGDWRSTHADLSEIDLRFRDMAKESASFLDRNQFNSADDSTKFLAYPLQPWPTFLGRTKLDELKRVSLEVSRLLRSVPDRIFRGDPVKLSSFYDLGSPTMAEVLFTRPTGAETMISRGDLIATADGFKCIEFNFTPSLGGWDTTIVTALQLSAPPTARFLETEGLSVSFTDTMLEVFRHILEDVRHKGIVRGKEVTIVFTASPEEVAVVRSGVGYFETELRRTLEFLHLDWKGRVLACTPDRLVPKGDGLFLDGVRADALIELSGLTPPHIYRHFKGDLVGLYNGPMSFVLSNKRNVALLSQNAGSGAFSADERAFIEKHVPWTRLVAEGPIDYAGGTYPLTELLTDQQELFVLKDSDASGGKGVLLGRFASREQWRETLQKALSEGDWVVQEVLESLPYLYQSGDYGCSIHDVIWGPFVFGDRYTGVVLRMQPKAAGGAVNLSLHATEGIVLEV